MRDKKNRNIEKGFSLIELGVVLMILSVILGASISLFIERKKSDRIQETVERMDVIEEAIAQFVLRNGRIPCPADVSATFNEPTFGQESIVANIGADTCEDGNYGDSGNSVVAGMVPAQALGLSREYTIDGWNKRFMYVVDERFANNTTTNENCIVGFNAECFKLQGSCRGDLTDVECEAALPSDTLNIWSTVDAAQVIKIRGVAYALLSFGENSAGAFNMSGLTRVAQPAGIDELENASDIGFNEDIVSRGKSEDFDDIVRYRTKHQILDSIGKMPSELLCLVAENVINVNIANGEENHACAGTSVLATNGSDCTSYAQAIDNLCLSYYTTILAP